MIFCFDCLYYVYMYIEVKKEKSSFFNRGIIQLPVLIIAGIALAATVLPLVLNQVQKRTVSQQRAEEETSTVLPTPTLPLCSEVEVDGNYDWKNCSDIADEGLPSRSGCYNNVCYTDIHSTLNTARDCADLSPYCRYYNYETCGTKTCVPPSGSTECSCSSATQTPTPTPTSVAKTCNVMVSSTSVAVGAGLTATATGVGNSTGGEPVRLYVERSDGSAIPMTILPGGTKQYIFPTSGKNYYELARCTSTNHQACTITKSLYNLPAGDYKVHCDLMTDPPPTRCTGDPFCDFNETDGIGSGLEDCHEWASCSDNDNTSFSVGFLWQKEAEADDVIIVAPMVRESSGDASACGFITSPTHNSGKATYSFSVPVAGNYYLWARVKGTSGQHNSFWFSFDDEAETVKHLETAHFDNTWHWEEVKPDEEGSSADNEYQLTTGNHTLTFGGRETNSGLDKILLTNDPDFVPTAITQCGGTVSPTPTLTPTATTTPAFYVERKEAESGTLTSSMNPVYDTTASACHYVTAPTGESGGTVDYTFTVPAAGNYYLWARSKGVDWTHNSFTVSFVGAGGTSFAYEIGQFNGNWQWGWGKVKTDPFVPTTNVFSLTAGSHTLRFARREPDAKLDEVLLTDSATYVPDYVQACGSNTPTPTTTPPASACNCLENAAAKAVGDADCDGSTDGIDFEIWRQEFLGLLTTTDANFNCGEDDIDIVNGVDFEIWRSNRQ